MNPIYSYGQNNNVRNGACTLVNKSEIQQKIETNFKFVENFKKQDWNLSNTFQCLVLISKFRKKFYTS